MDFTIVNFLPYALEETKPGLIPDKYYVPGSKDGKPGVLHIGDAKSHLYIRDGKTFPILHSAEEVAKSIVEDYNIAQLEASHDAHPALFYLPGKISATAVLTVPELKKTVDEARKKQNLWFMRLVRKADDDWKKYGQHRMITDIQRHAASSLGMINKEWYHNPEPEEFVKCPACRVTVEATAAVCHNCNYIINEARAAELGISKASVAKPVEKPVEQNSGRDSGSKG